MKRYLFSAPVRVLLFVLALLVGAGDALAALGQAPTVAAPSTAPTGARMLAATPAASGQYTVAMFLSDNNGLVVSLPAVASSTTSISGSIYFGVATQTNNTPSGGTVLTTDAVGYITTVLSGASMVNSFIDSGSNGLYFNSSAMPSCTEPLYNGFYCPSGLTAFTATMSVTAPTPASVTVPFSVDKASTILNTNANWSVFPTLADRSGDPTSFDWGLPFFFGRNVFIGFEGRTSSLGSGTYFAF